MEKVNYDQIAEVIQEGYLISEALKVLNISSYAYRRYLTDKQRKRLLLMRPTKATGRVYNVPHSRATNNTENKQLDKFILNAY